ncbi:ATP-binding cassette domain-containing protein, partial [bacterium]|nr:ATP-binding cassette domain-containing protein [bacterium]
KNVSLEVQRGDHVAVVGLNGAGKSTLLKGLAGSLTPLTGERVLGYQVDVAIFNQHVTEVLNPEHSVFESLEEKASEDITTQEIRNMAGSLLFSADHIEKKIKVLSGGEKSRVALGRILLQKVPCLLLDEPTNHLDFETVEALTQALNNYPGTLIVVSHDRGFIRRVGTKILEVSQGQVHTYPGTYDEYVWSLQQKLANQEDIEEETSEPVSMPDPAQEMKAGKSRKLLSKHFRSLEKQIQKIEQQIEKIENENIQLNSQISGGVLSVSQLSECVEKLSNNVLLLEEHETQWLALSEELATENK